MRFLADENFDNRILRGLLRKDPTADIVRVQDTEIVGADDPTVLEWAAGEGRILLTHDIQTLNGFAYERLAAGLPMPGVFQIGAQLPVGQVIENLLLVNGASEASEWDLQVKHFPLF
jgi:hypothetical protein